ncbi:MAG TPA: TIGR01212 family radical SAM protein [Desulfobulbaceae bacterium]|nr:TIGR01212 family radical SAM protein [Desulfobulbaceae bacterium]
MTETGPPRIRTFSYHYRQKFGRSVGKIPLDVGMPCPNRERGGCIFCRPAGFTPYYLSKSDDLTRQVAAGKAGLLQGRFRGYFAYFQQETCTAMPAERLLPLLREVLADPDCVGLILSTRPDCVDDALILPLAELVTKSARECLFELGLQSVHERSLAFLNRNHGFADFCQAAERIRAAGSFQLGAHLIIGIPGETEEDMLASLAEVCRRGVTHLKLHHLQVIRETPLHDLYELGRVPVFSRWGYLDFLLRVLPRIPADITIHRLWATAHPDLLVAPKWQILAGQLSRELLEKMAELGIWQGQLAVQDRMNGR